MEKNKLNYITYLVIFCVILSFVGCFFLGTYFGEKETVTKTEEKNPDEDEIKEFLSGNLCRCSGYEGQLRGILDYLRVKKAKEASVENKENIAEEVK